MEITNHPQGVIDRAVDRIARVLKLRPIDWQYVYFRRAAIRSERSLGATASSRQVIEGAYKVFERLNVKPTVLNKALIEGMYSESLRPPVKDLREENAVRYASYAFFRITSDLKVESRWATKVESIRKLLADYFEKEVKPMALTGKTISSQQVAQDFASLGLPVVIAQGYEFRIDQEQGSTVLKIKPDSAVEFMTVRASQNKQALDQRDAYRPGVEILSREEMAHIRSGAIFNPPPASGLER